MNRLFIDVPNKAAGNVIFNRLKSLKTTSEVTRPVNYQFCGQTQNECQMLLVTTKTEKEVDDWLYASKGVDYIGCGPEQ